eukprot:TRINITY_DN8506_c0_g1_i2.p1 TRINITY_DN8506_c0_g1~~TRINITY_DN8506_c0_g1_i2.p1  ORF type:complete len:232 (-),score=18.85 TRINITY_DN8506_c0_g1_i2:220-915(-)
MSQVQEDNSLNRLEQLPSEVVVRLVETLMLVSNPAAVINLMLVNKKMFVTVQSLDELWQEKCSCQGWYHEGVTDKLQKSEWFKHYCQRMQARWRIRRLLKLYIRFLNIRSQSALQPGANAGMIALHEQRLGFQLPWELWELFRYRNGQLQEVGAIFIDELRLYRLQETISETRQVVFDGQFKDIKVIKVTDEGRGGKYFAVGEDGNVYACSGFRTIIVANSVGALIQRLLH